MHIPSPVVLLTLVLLFCAGCTDRWEGFIYPNKNDRTQHHTFGPFASLQACRTAAKEMLVTLQAREHGDYACGHHCDNGSRVRGTQICQETRR